MELNSKNIRKILFIIFCGAVIFSVIENFSNTLGFLGKAVGVFTPVIAALCIAFVLNVPMSLLETKVFAFLGKSKKSFVRGIRRPLCLILTYLLALGLLTLLVLVIIPDIVDTIIYLFERMPTFIVETRDWLEDLLYNFNISQDVIPEISIDWNGAIEAIKTWFNNSYSVIFNDAVSTTTSIFGGVFDGIFSLMISVYVLAQKEKIGVFVNKCIDRFIKPKTASYIRLVSSRAFEAFSRFIRGQFAECFILGTLCFIGMKIFGFPNAVIISVIVGITALVPVVGAISGGVIGGLLILITDPIKAILFIIYLIILQQLEGNLIYPKVMGKVVGIPGLLVVCAVLVGGNIGGVFGALIGVPICAVVYSLLRDAIETPRIKVDANEINN